MLDKFRCDYIIHFYGACLMMNKTSLVTEFAQYGSLRDLMTKEECNNIKKSMKIKFMLDSAKGIEYLHDNGILHRDIKCDNILIVSLDEDIHINAKLTDFGSSRNLNMMMTNMTFTKGVGTPVYMAPEILNQQHYKKPADVFSFGVTIYECLIWNDCYPNDKFKFSWNIAEFVVNGGRMPIQKEYMNENEYLLIEKCWTHNPLDRITIGKVVEWLNLM